MTRSSSNKVHASRDVAHAISLFFAVRRIMRTKLARGKKVDPSTWLQTETMKFIADHDNSKMKDVAEYLSITAPSTTSLIGGLVKSGFVICHVDPHDRRASRIVLTPKGKAELKKAITTGMRHLRELFAVISDTELAAFSTTLERIKEHGA